MNLTIEDLRASTKSGFRQVTKVNPSLQKSHYQAYANAGRRGDWKGPCRETPEEAAQDYCNYINGDDVLTVDDLYSLKLKSNYRYVADDSAAHPTSTKRFFAQGGTRPRSAGEKTNHWKGQYRTTAKEAAQDYCDWYNGQIRTARIPARLGATQAATGTRMTKAKFREPDHGPLYAQLEAQQGKQSGDSGKTGTGRKTNIGLDTPGVLYLVAERGTDLRKIGWSKEGRLLKRVKEHQTGNPRDIILLAFKPGTKRDENALHLKHIDDGRSSNGEWFTATAAIYADFDLPWTTIAGEERPEAA